MLRGFRKILKNRKVNFAEILKKCENSYENCENIDKIGMDFRKILKI